MQRRFLRIIIIAITIPTTTTTITIITVTTTTHKHTGLTNKKACPGFLATGSLLAGFALLDASGQSRLLAASHHHLTKDRG